MSDNEQQSDDRSVRLNVRIPRKQYEMMKRFGDALGFETDSASIKHFLTLGLQASASGVHALLNVDAVRDSVIELKRMNDAVEQMDLVKEVEAASRARA